MGFVEYMASSLCYQGSRRKCGGRRSINGKRHLPMTTTVFAAARANLYLDYVHFGLIARPHTLSPPHKATDDARCQSVTVRPTTPSPELDLFALLHHHHQSGRLIPVTKTWQPPLTIFDRLDTILITYLSL